MASFGPPRATASAPILCIKSSNLWSVVDEDDVSFFLSLFISSSSSGVDKIKVEVTGMSWVIDYVSKYLLSGDCTNICSRVFGLYFLNCYKVSSNSLFDFGWLGLGTSTGISCCFLCLCSVKYLLLLSLNSNISCCNL